MRIRVPTRLAFTVALALAVLTACSYYVYTLRHRAATPTRPGALHNDSADAQQWTDPQVLVAAADHFYFLNNGPAAAPLYARAILPVVVVLDLLRLSCRSLASTPASDHRPRAIFMRLLVQNAVRRLATSDAGMPIADPKLHLQNRESATCAPRP